MKKLFSLQAFLLLLMIVVLPGCDLIAGIFKAGVWVGVIIVIVIIVLIIWLLRKVFR